MYGITKLTIEGFKSIRQLKDFELRPLNVLIGANGAGKSNFVGFFNLLREMVDQRLQFATSKGGGGDAFLFFGPKITREIKGNLLFGKNGYEFTLVPTINNRLILKSENTVSILSPSEIVFTEIESSPFESALKDYWLERGSGGERYRSEHYLFKAITDLVDYHFHDSSDTAEVRRSCAINDNDYLRPDASNLAAFLYRLQLQHPDSYAKIRNTVRLAAPFFYDFKLRRIVDSPEMIQLEWLQKDSDYPFRPSQLSDGTLRFICLATALLQPSPPSMMLFDEPELGLHPYALTLLANLFKQISRTAATQLVVSTQSALLLNEFEPDDVIVVERAQGQSTFRRLDSEQLGEWLQEYGLGELWQKNVLGGRPRNESLAMPPEVKIDVPIQHSNGSAPSVRS